MKLLLPATFCQLVATTTRDLNRAYTELVCLSRAPPGLRRAGLTQNQTPALFLLQGLAQFSQKLRPGTQMAVRRCPAPAAFPHHP